MEVIDWIWPALVLLMMALSTTYSSDDYAKSDPNYLTQRSRLPPMMSDLRSRVICTLFGLILASFAVSKSTIRNYLVTYPSSASNIMALVHGVILNSASCTCLHQLPTAGDRCNDLTHRQWRTKLPPYLCTSVRRIRQFINLCSCSTIDAVKCFR